MCGCTWNWTCTRCQGSRYFGEGYLLDDPEENDPYYSPPDDEPAAGRVPLKEPK